MRRKNRPTDAAYLAWIRTQRCAASSGPSCCKGPVTAHHAGVHGLGQKPSDRTAIPLYAHHHQHGPRAVHVLGKAFWLYHNLDREQLIHFYSALYASEHETVLNPLEVGGIIA